MRTGDLGFVHDGELYITGRIKDLIILRGRNLYPQDIEQSAEASHPALRNGCGAAFAVEADGGDRLVFVAEVERSGRTVPVDKVAAAVSGAVSEAHEVPVDAVILLKPGSIPKTSSGKIQRHVCKASYLMYWLDGNGPPRRARLLPSRTARLGRSLGLPRDRRATKSGRGSWSGSLASCGYRRANSTPASLWPATASTR
jgi:hypothetical protein